MAENTANKKRIYFENLDGLRFFCFLAVFFFHSFHTDNPIIISNSTFGFIKQDVFGNGFLGVNFFFVLSGFLITTLLIAETKLNGKINIPKFWVRRVLRIWPLYFACVFFGFVLFPLAKSVAGGIPHESANVWYYLGFINNFDYIQKGLPDAPGLGVLWSVAIEEQFYIVWPVILSFFALKNYWVPFIIIIAGSLVFRALYDIPIYHEMHTLSCIGDMAIGAFGAWLFNLKPKFSNFIIKMPRGLIIFFYILLLGIFFFRDEFLLNTYYLRIFERAFVSSIILIIILEQCFSENSFYKMNSFRRLSRLGIFTYGLYCLHFIVISAVAAVLKKLNMENHMWQVFILQPVISLTITIIAAKLSFKYFENPFLKMKDRFGYILKK